MIHLCELHDRDKSNYERRRPHVDLCSANLARDLARILWALRDALPGKTVARVRKEIGAREESEERIENPGRDTPYRRAIRFKTPVAEATISVMFRKGL